jgi:hypothetical protein
LNGLDEGGVARDTVRFNEMLHLEDLSVDGRIPCRQPIEGAAEFERAVQIGWAMPSGLRKSEIRDCRRRAWRLDQPSRAGCGLICASIDFKGPEWAARPSIGGPYPVFASIVSYPDFPMIYRWPAAALGQLGRVAEAKAMLDDEKGA